MMPINLEIYIKKTGKKNPSCGGAMLTHLTIGFRLCKYNNYIPYYQNVLTKKSMNKYKKHLYTDTDYLGYLFEKMENRETLKGNNTVALPNTTIILLSIIIKDGYLG
jgi:hypothetical protein